MDETPVGTSLACQYSFDDRQSFRFFATATFYNEAKMGVYFGCFCLLYLEGKNDKGLGNPGLEVDQNLRKFKHLLDVRIDFICNCISPRVSRIMHLFVIWSITWYTPVIISLIFYPKAPVQRVVVTFSVDAFFKKK